MSSIPKHIIIFKEFSPDSLEFDSNFMERMINVAPLFSSYRQMPHLDLISEVAVDSPPSGSFIHHTSEPSGEVILQPGVDVSPAAGVYSIVPPSITEYFEAINGTSPNDGTFITLPATGLAELLKIDLTNNPGGLDPAANMDVKLRYRIDAGTGSWTILYEIKRKSDDVVVTTKTVNGTFGAQTVFIQDAVSTLLGAGNEDVQFYVEISFTGDTQPASSHPPVDDVAVTLWSGSEASSPLALLLDKTAGADDTKYVFSPQLALDAESSARFKLAAPAGTVVAQDHTLTVRYEAEEDGMDLRIRLLDITPTLDEPPTAEIEVLTTTLVDVTANTPTDEVIVLTQPQMDSILDHTNLEIETTWIGGTGSAAQTSRPNADVTKGAFTKFGGGTGAMFNEIKNDSDLDGIKSDVNDNSYRCGFPPIIDPEDVAGTYQAVIRARMSGGDSSGDYLVRLYSGGLQFKSSNESLSGSFAAKNIAFNYGQVSNWANIDVRITPTTIEDPGDGFECTSIKIEVPGNISVGRIIAVDMEYPDELGADFSWLNVTAPLVGTFFPGDQQKLYLGTNESLWQGETPNYDLIDVSKTAPASYTPAGASGWMFSSYGQALVATNYIDPVQVKDIGDALFSDLFVPGGDPAILDIRSRHVATIASQLCFGDINPDFEPLGRADTFWAGALGEVEKIHLADVSTQSTFFHLVTTPGGITGMVGGEYGFIFKENSFFRANYVGLPVIWEFEQISKFQGTPYPRSIVKAENDIYFWGSGGIFHVSDYGRNMRRIGATRMEKFLFDTGFEPEALRPNPGSDIRENWGAVFGAYDPYSGLIIWPYRIQGDLYGENEGMVIYSRKEDRFTIADGENITLPLGLQDSVDPAVLAQLQNWDMAEMVARGNVVTNETHNIRGIWPVQHVPPNMRVMKFTGIPVQPAFMLTNTYISQSFPGVEQSQEIAIQKLRPVFRSEFGQAGALKCDFFVVRSDTPNYEEFSVHEFSYDNKDFHSWVSSSGPISGQFFKFLVVLHGVQETLVKEFVGLEVSYEIRGDY